MTASYREKIYKRYVETYSEVYRKKDYLKEFSSQSELYELNYKTILPPNKKSTILELGSGPGYFLKYLLDNGYENIFGVDTSPQQLEVASQLGINSVSHSDIFDFLKSSNNKYDFICSFHVLEHLFKDEIIELIEMINLRLNKGGMILIEVPNSGSPLLGNQGRYGEFTHEVGFTASSLREILLVCGFTDVRILPVVALSPFARFFFKAVNYILHSRFTKDMFVDGDIIGVGHKKD